MAMTASGSEWELGVDDELCRLEAAAESAYQRVRLEVLDQLPPGSHRDEEQLTDRQRVAVWALFAAEAELGAYRDDHPVAGP